MRELIRPTLFIVARLGLFLAVVAWVVGQSWSVSASVPLAKTASCEIGWIIAGDAGGESGWDFEVQPGAHTHYLNEIFQPIEDNPKNRRLGIHLGFLRLQRLEDPMSGFFAIAHWFIVTIFTVFNICLHWFYRRHPEVQSCES